MRFYDTASVVGRFSGNLWMEATDFVYGAASSGKFEKVGVVLLIRSGDGYINLGGVGREMLSKIHVEMGFLGVENGEEVKELLVRLGEMFAEISVEVLVFGVCGDKVLLAGVGGGGASLLRGDSLGKILSTTEHVGVVTGDLKVGDVLVFASGDFYEKIVYSDMKNLLSQGHGERFGLAASLASQMAVYVQEIPVGSAVSALVLAVGDKPSDVGETKRENKIETLKVWWKKIAERGVYLKDRSGADPQIRKKRRLGLLVLFVLTIVFLVSLGVRARSVAIKNREERVASVVGPVQELIDEANEVSGVNKLRSRSLLLSARELLSSGVGQFSEKSAERKLVEELLAKVETDYQKISGEIKVEPQVFLDLSLVSSGFVGGAMVNDEGRVLVLSDISGVVVEIEAQSKKAKILAGGVSGARLVGTGTGGDFVLADDGVVQIEDGDKKTVVSREDVWEEVVGFGVFGSNLYLLDKGVGEIWKYIPSDGSFVSRRWLAPGVQPNFSRVVDMYIDGDIWVVDNDGVVRSYSGGVPKSVEMKGLVEGISGAKSLVVGENRVWVLDRVGKRVVGFDREGVYQEQYMWDGFGLASDMVVVSIDEGNKMLVLSGEKIYLINL